jgi:hypothetical protein
VLTTIRNNEAAAQTVIDVTSTINFRGGEIIDGVTISTGVVIEPAREVISVDRTNRTITVTPALTTGLTATTDGWVRASSDSTVAVPNNSQNKEIQGLASIVAATGTLHGLSPTTYTFWKSFVDATGGAISDAKLRSAKSNSQFESGLDNQSGADFVILTTRGIRDNYSATLTALKRFNDAQSMTLRGGFEALMFDSNPIFTDDQCPVSTVWGLSLKKLAWMQASDWDWMEEDGKVLKWESRKDRYIAVLYKYCQLMTTARNAHFKLTGITDDVR